MDSDPDSHIEDLLSALHDDDRYDNQIDTGEWSSDGPQRGESWRDDSRAYGIPLVSLNTLPDRFRSIFPFPVFNAIQSRTFPAVFESSDNLVLSSPTGSGKTVILELAICRMITTREQGTYKIIYQAPTKALCSERKRDWEKKFSTLGLTVTELTGDTEHNQIGVVKNGDLIVTTPEKWDSMTRRWQDQRKLLDMVKLFLIDEVHILKDTRGATLEVVVSRMKSIGIDVRFVALSATVPNLEDIATWLGRNSQSDEPAQLERFGEEFRPVRLQKFVYGYSSNMNDFAFDKTLEKHLPEIIRKHSSRKPVLIFCMTRNMCSSTSKFLAQNHTTALWPLPHGNFAFRDKELQAVAVKGVAFHHAGMDVADRTLVEKLYLEGLISVICCTSTLSVGVNLPAHLVILKNTVTWADGKTQEYVDLEVMQMLGRAGRPQFDDSGVAVIMTRSENKAKYEKLVTGHEKLESCLHLNMIEHLNAEISLGTITSLESAKRWLKSTFLWVRLRQNPAHYRLPGQPALCLTGADQKLEEILEKDLAALESEQIIAKGANGSGSYKNTEYGVCMARYYVKFETMKVILRLEKKAKVSAILMAMSQAGEYSEIRFRSGEKTGYKELNKSTSMKYPLKDITEPFHKVYLLMQADIGSIEWPTGDGFAKFNSTFIQEKAMVNQHAQRIIRAIVDCRIHDKDAVTTRNALEIARCLSAKCWENSPAQIRQLEGLGVVYVRKLVTAGIRSLADLRNTEGFKLEQILTRNPPFGMKLLKDVANIPIFRVYADVISHSGDLVNPVKASVRVEMGCLNDRTPEKFHGRLLYAIFIAETDGGADEARTGDYMFYGL
ncbi:putative DEAD/DEAH box DNA helicase [Ascobolus immersus RN42]|uniref:DNA 3'-5' helicase n=1 Tax=Ascobolus immersus RN42 TaxID=1160509 RepID=A0A3N4HRJ4_ASCIM|nr:putative DEAD/DEAH box DNA helicase [Ascobolus immersus RN42]